jgi:hypothetical protein
MSKRERTLALIVLPVILLIGGWLIVAELWLKPLNQREEQIAQVLKDIHERRETVEGIEARKKDLGKYRTLSLPVDADLARREYEDQLSKMLRSSGFEAGSFSVTPKPLDTKTSPQQANKKPIYSRLIFTVQAKGELVALVDFMEKFYKLPLLHQIHNIAVQRPLSGGQGARATDLDINLTVEALVLDNAEPRKTLLPEKPPEVKLLASEPRKYGAIAGRDVFFGPAPPAAQQTRKSEVDYAKHIKFVSLTEGEKGLEATFYDAYNQHEFTVHPRLDGDGFRVEETYVLGGRRRVLRSGKAIELMDENGELQHRWLVLRLTDREMYLQDEDFYYTLHLGQWLSDMTRLSLDEAQTLGLVAAKKPATDEKAK